MNSSQPAIPSSNINFDPWSHDFADLQQFVRLPRFFRQSNVSLERFRNSLCYFEKTYPDPIDFSKIADQKDREELFRDIKDTFYGILRMVRDMRTIMDFLKTCRDLEMSTLADWEDLCRWVEDAKVCLSDLRKRNEEYDIWAVKG